jgi:hypothetical protein
VERQPVGEERPPHRQDRPQRELFRQNRCAPDLPALGEHPAKLDPVRVDEALHGPRVRFEQP